MMGRARCGRKESRMAEYIDRQLCEIVAEYDEYYRLVVSLNKIRKIPAADVAPVVHGRWDEHGKCIVCGGHAPFWCMASTYYTSQYCPECGAKMDGDQDG